MLRCRVFFLWEPNVARHNMKNLSVYLKSAMVTSWKINSTGGKGRWGQRKKEINRGKGLRREGDQRAWKVGGCLQLPLPLHKDFQMCSCSGRGLQQSPFHQPSTRILYQGQTITSSTLPLSHLTPPSLSYSPWPFLSSLNTTVLEQGCSHHYV